MKKVVSKKVRTIVAVVLAALALAAVACAANVPGNLSGGGGFVGPNGVGRIDMNGGGVTDGQIDPAFYNKNNDRSGTCTGDSGTINVKYGDGAIASYSIICAHYSNCISMSFDYIDTHIDPTGATYVIVRAINIKPPAGDRIQVGVDHRRDPRAGLGQPRLPNVGCEDPGLHVRRAAASERELDAHA